MKFFQWMLEGLPPWAGAKAVLDISIQIQKCVLVRCESAWNICIIVAANHFKTYSTQGYWCVRLNMSPGSREPSFSNALQQLEVSLSAG